MKYLFKYLNYCNLCQYGKSSFAKSDHDRNSDCSNRRTKMAENDNFYQMIIKYYHFISIAVPLGCKGYPRTTQPHAAA